MPSKARNSRTFRSEPLRRHTTCSVTPAENRRKPRVFRWRHTTCSVRRKWLPNRLEPVEWLYRTEGGGRGGCPPYSIRRENQSISASISGNHSIPQHYLTNLTRFSQIPFGFRGNGIGMCADNLGNQLRPTPYTIPRWFIQWSTIWYPTLIHKVIHSLTYHCDICCADTTQNCTIMHNLARKWFSF